jgi:hypothetical protein
MYSIINVTALLYFIRKYTSERVCTLWYNWYIFMKLGMNFISLEDITLWSISEIPLLNNTKSAA